MPNFMALPFLELAGSVGGDAVGVKRACVSGRMKPEVTEITLASCLPTYGPAAEEEIFMSNFAMILSVADDAPGCGTKWPRWRPQPWPRFEAGPSPDPWATAEVFVAMHASVRIAQAGRAVGGQPGDQMARMAA